MKFGLFFELQVPRPWTGDDEVVKFAEAIEQIELADKLGFDCVWLVEHHFLEEYSHSSAPELFLAAVSQRTDRIRLGHGIVNMLPAINHPARVAERISTLDVLSGGRVEFGTGEGSAAAELGGFGIERSEKHAMWEESTRVALRCMTEVPFTGHEGDHVCMPPRNVVPKPIQKPHPPVWVACSRLEAARIAARHAVGALTFKFLGPDDAATWVDEYYSTFESEGVPIGDSVNPNVACVTSLFCHQDAGQAASRGSEGSRFFEYGLAHYNIFGDHSPAGTDLWSEFVAQNNDHGFDSNAVQLAVENSSVLGADLVCSGTRLAEGAVGTRQQVRAQIRRYEASGIDQLILSCSTGRTKHEHIMESLELFGRDVLPEFAERDAEQRREKDRRLEPVVTKVLARKPDSDHPQTDPDYSISAYPVSARDGGLEQRWRRR